MRIPLLLPLSFTLLACGARTEIEGAAEARNKESPERACNEEGVFTDEPPPCEGSGLIFTVTDECIDDGGSASGDDSLEVYCIHNIARFCLSNEQCLWRGGTTSEDPRTCSRSGLKTDYMANTRKGCAGFDNHEWYCCSSEGRISFADH
jgi:hypothetical protein